MTARFSREPFGPTVVALMAERHCTYRQLGAGAGIHFSHVHRFVFAQRYPYRVDRPRRDQIERIAAYLQVAPEHFREYRLLVVMERLAAQPELEQRVYRKLAA